MTSWLWQKLEKMPGVSQRNSSAWCKCVSVCLCVRPWAIRVLLGFVNESQTRQRQKQNLTNSNMKQRAGHLPAAHLLAPVCEKRWVLGGWWWGGVVFEERERKWSGRKLQRKRDGGPGSCRRGSGVNSACRPGWRFQASEWEACIASWESLVCPLNLASDQTDPSLWLCTHRDAHTSV